jgi:L-ascorbate oxidase
MSRYGSIRHSIRTLSSGALAVGLALLTTESANAQAARTVTNPRVLAPRPQEPERTNLLADAEAGGAPGERVLDLNVVYTKGQLYNPSTGRYDQVRLRSYNGTDVDPKTPYVSPTIEVTPGETVRISLNNQLPADSSCASGDQAAPDVPHCFNGTNLHTHGLWVNPSGNGDNVLLSINPGVSFQYEYNIPADHPAGTFWYHTHRHGSTALQVSSGMAGALIVRGSRPPTPTTHGDLDTLLEGMPERILVMQQIQYGCLDSNGNIKVKTDSKGNVIAWVCDPGDTGVIETYADANGNGFGPGTWDQSGRYTSINGQILPTFQAKQGQVERWRIIQAGVRDTLGLQFFKAKSAASLKPGPKLRADSMDDLIDQSCSDEPLSYNLAAADGLTMAAVQSTQGATFQPGYRFDALVIFPEAGRYCVVDSASKAAGSVGGAAVSPRLLGMVDVAPGTAVPDIRSYLTAALVGAAQANLPADIRAAVVADLQNLPDPKNPLQLTRFTPHPTIADSEVTGTQELTFFIDTTGINTAFEVGGKGYAPRPYVMERIDRQLTVGDVEEWILQSHFVSHPFHIHVNPFQVVSITDPNGIDVSAPGAIDNAGGGTPDTQYPGLRGVWKDTLWVKSLLPPPVPQGGGNGIYTVKVRTRYQRYIGEFVLHCHILDHEDQGMMQNVSIGLPGGSPTATARLGHEH